MYITGGNPPQLRLPHASLFGFAISFTIVFIFSFLPQRAGNDNHYLTSTTTIGLSAAFLGLFFLTVVVVVGILLLIHRPGLSFLLANLESRVGV
jgi:predicted branched-subunit amino acid permease